MIKFVVTRDNPYYPDVFYCETIESAQAKRDEWFKGMNEIDGTFENLIVIAEIKEQIPFKSSY